MLIKITDLFDKINRKMLCIYILSIPLWKGFSTILIFVWLASTFFSFKKENRSWSNMFLLLVSLYICFCISIFYSDNFGFKYIEQRASLLVFPILFYLNGTKIKKIEFNKPISFFIYGCILSVCYCIVNSFFNSVSLENGSFIFSPYINEGENFIDSSIYGGNYFYGMGFSVLHHATYFSMFLCFAIAALLFGLSNIQRRTSSYLLVILFTVVVIQLSSKAGIFTLSIIYLYYIISNFKLKKALIISGIFSLTIIAVTFYNPRIKNAVSNVINLETNFHPEDSNSFSLRLMAWQSSLVLIKNNPILGVGIGDVYDELKEQYRIKRYIYAYRYRLNAHNQYLQVLLECGIVGLLILLAQLVVLMKLKLKKSHKKLATALCIILLINFISESVLGQYSGIMFYSFMMCFLVIHNKNREY